MMSPALRNVWILGLLLAGAGRAQFDVVPTAIPCTGCPFPLVADFDGENGPDLVFADGNTLRWMANDGNGAFSGPVELAVNPGYLRSNLAQDIDGDADIDVVGITTTFDGTSIWLMRNDGTDFTPVLVDTIGSTFRAPDTAVDLDGDGDLDLLGVDHSFGELWHRNNGDGTYQREVIGRWCTNGVKGPYAPVDVEGDGDLDLVGFADPIGRLIVHWNLGMGMFGPFTIASGFMGHFPAGLAMDAVDVDQDGFTDIVAGGRALFSTGYGTFAGSGLPLSSQEFQSVRDVDCDAALEALLSSNGSMSVTDFDLESELAYDLNIPENVRSTLADLNADGREDLITGTGSGGPIAWRMNISVPPVTTLALPWDTLYASEHLELTGGDPVSGGGVYSGTGVYDGRFYPLVAGPGYTRITYTYSDFNDFTACIGSATDSVYVMDFTSVEEHPGPGMMVYPNPVTDVLMFRSDARGPIDLIVLDMVGREVLHDRAIGTGWDSPIPLRNPDLSKGSYQLIVRDKEGVITTTRFVVGR